MSDNKSNNIIPEQSGKTKVPLPTYTGPFTSRIRTHATEMINDWVETTHNTLIKALKVVEKNSMSENENASGWCRFGILYYGVQVSVHLEGDPQGSHLELHTPEKDRVYLRDPWCSLTPRGYQDLEKVVGNTLNVWDLPQYTLCNSDDHYKSEILIRKMTLVMTYGPSFTIKTDSRDEATTTSLDMITFLFNQLQDLINMGLIEINFSVVVKDVTYPCNIINSDKFRIKSGDYVSAPFNIDQVESLPRTPSGFGTPLVELIQAQEEQKMIPVIEPVKIEQDQKTLPSNIIEVTSPGIVLNCNQFLIDTVYAVLTSKPLPTLAFNLCPYSLFEEGCIMRGSVPNPKELCFL